MNLSKRISKVEQAIKPTPSDCGVIVAHSQEEADEKVLEFRKTNPLAATPCILIDPGIKKPPNSGL